MSLGIILDCLNILLIILRRRVILAMNRMIILKMEKYRCFSMHHREKVLIL